MSKPPNPPNFLPAKFSSLKVSYLSHGKGLFTDYSYNVTLKFITIIEVVNLDRFAYRTFQNLLLSMWLYRDWKQKRLTVIPSGNRFIYQYALFFPITFIWRSKVLGLYYWNSTSVFAANSAHFLFYISYPITSHICFQQWPSHVSKIASNTKTQFPPYKPALIFITANPFQANVPFLYPL